MIYLSDLFNVGEVKKNQIKIKRNIEKSLTVNAYEKRAQMFKLCGNLKKTDVKKHSLLDYYKKWNDFFIGNY